MAFSVFDAASAYEGGAYLNPQLFSSITASLSSITASSSSLAELEMHTFMVTTGLPTTPMYSVKQIDEVTSPGRTPSC